MTTTSSMKALQFPEKGSTKITSLPLHALKEQEVLVKVRASGICHTDIEVLHGRYGTSAFPLVPGHEYTGEVAEIGSNVKHYAVGDRVVIDPNIECGVCRACLAGRTNLCVKLRAYGVTENGGFAEYSTVSESALVPLGPLSFEVGALAEPVACVLNGIEAVGLEGVSSTLIFGAGPIGMLMALAIRSKGVANVTMVDINEKRLDMAKTFGLNGILSSPAELKQHEQEFDLVVDATGNAAVAGGLVNYATNGGKVLFFGVCAPDVQIQVSPFEIFRRQLTLAGAHSLNHNIADAIQTIEAIGPDISRVISHRLPLEEIPSFMQGQAPADCMKVQAILD